MTAALRYYENGRRIEREKLQQERADERAFVEAHARHFGFSTIAETAMHCPSCRATFTRMA